jgi:hypothetical protein
MIDTQKLGWRKIERSESGISQVCVSMGGTVERKLCGTVRWPKGGG